MTDVSIIVQFLVALVGLGVSIDYALVMIFRFREELAAGRDPDDALVETMTHAGRSVIISGSTVAIGLLSMVILPLPFIRSIGIGGMLIPAVAVLASLTLLPALFSLLGPPDQPAARDAEALRGAAERGVRLLGGLGAPRDPPAAADLPAGRGHRHARRSSRPSTSTRATPS